MLKRGLSHDFGVPYDIGLEYVLVFSINLHLHISDVH